MSLKERRAHNDAIRASMPPGSVFSGPQVEVILEGWFLVGWHPGVAHYWRRGHGDDVFSTCGLIREFELDIRGRAMVFEAGNHPRCRKCMNMRGRR